MPALHPALVIAAMVLTGLASQKPEDGRTGPPIKGDNVVIRGCVSGGLLRDLRALKTDDMGAVGTAMVYKLRGDKKVLQQMQQDHPSDVLDVSGLLEDVPNTSSTVRSKQMGKTRVYVGAGQQAASEPTKAPEYPVVRVRSFEVVGPGCR